MKLNILSIIAAALAMFSLGSCENGNLSEGVVARVNGEEIYLHDLRNVMDIRMGASGLSVPQSLEETRKNYVDALNYMIAQILIRQEFEKKGIVVDEKAYRQALREVIDDYGKEDYGAALDEAFIREEDFERLLRDQINMEVFKSSVLYPEIEITADEIKKYYLDHKSAFERPETYYLCSASSPDRKELEAWIANANRGIIDESEIANCLWLPSDGDAGIRQSSLKSLKINVCAPPEHIGNEWRTALILEKRPSSSASLPEAFALIEKILMDQKKYDAFNNWLEKKIKSSRIELIPELNESVSIVAGELAKDD